MIKRDLKSWAKKKLIYESWNKCANPGCTNYRVHIHHIKEWAVYWTNNPNDMIAVCPSCHDAIHYWKLKISDETLYQWKEIKRITTYSDAIFIEPWVESKLLLWSTTIQWDNVIVFEQSENKSLSFKLVDNDILFIDLKIADLNNNELLKVIQNQIRYKNEIISYQKVPWKILVSCKFPNLFIEEWAIKQMREHFPNYCKDWIIELLKIEVIKPWLVKISGIWMNHNWGYIVNENSISIIQKGLIKPISIMWNWEETTLKWLWPIGTSLFWKFWVK